VLDEPLVTTPVISISAPGCTISDGLETRIWDRGETELTKVLARAPRSRLHPNASSSNTPQPQSKNLALERPALSIRIVVRIQHGF
jgi:hypothetical protein